MYPLTPSKSVTVWLAIDDVDADGAMQFVPRTDILGPLAHDELTLDGTRVLGRQVHDIGEYGPLRGDLAQR